MKRIWVLGSAAALALAAGGGAADRRAGSGRVVDVVSGEILRVQVGRRTETLRLIGIRSAEGGAGAEEAVDLASRLVLGQAIRIESDPRLGERDGDGNLLGYVTPSGGSLLNAELVIAGLARVDSSSPFGRLDEFLAFEEEAREAQRGAWKGASKAPAEARGAIPSQSAGAARAAAPPIPSPAAREARVPVVDPGQVFYINPNGKKYHVRGCRFLGPEAIGYPLREAAREHLPCRTCRPPAYP